MRTGMAAMAYTLKGNLLNKAPCGCADRAGGNSCELVLCPADNFAESFKFGQDGVGGGGPHKGPRVLVVVLDELVDLAFEVRHGVKGAATDGALRNQSEPAFDLVEPRGVGWSVVDMEARTSGEPDSDSGVSVGAVVIDDQMNIQIVRNVGLDVAQEAQELLM